MSDTPVIKLNFNALYRPILESLAVDGVVSGRVTSIIATSKKKTLRMELGSGDNIVSLVTPFEGESPDLLAQAMLFFDLDGVVSNIKAAPVSKKSAASSKATPLDKAGYF